MFEDDANDATNNPVDPAPAQAEVNGQAVPAWDEPQTPAPAEEPAVPSADPVAPDWDAEPAPQVDPLPEPTESAPVEGPQV